MTHGIAFKRLTASGIVWSRDMVLYSVSGNAKTAGAIGTIYQGMSPNTEDILCILEAPTNQHRQLHWLPGIHIDGGLYLKMDANGVEVLFSFAPIRVDGIVGIPVRIVKP